MKKTFITAAAAILLYSGCTFSEKETFSEFINCFVGYSGRSISSDSDNFFKTYFNEYSKRCNSLPGEREINLKGDYLIFNGLSDKECKKFNNSNLKEVLLKGRFTEIHTSDNERFALSYKKSTTIHCENNQLKFNISGIREYRKKLLQLKSDEVWFSNAYYIEFKTEFTDSNSIN